MAIINEKREPGRPTRLSSAGPLACAAVGALYAVLGTFPVAAFVALVFRFPFPDAPYAGGVRAMLGSPIAVLIYGLAGGFYLLAVLGAVAGVIAHRRYQNRNDRNKHREIVVFAAVIDFIAVMLLAVWDKIYGPW
ncbi:MAG: hypothetical protein AB7O26_16805 [Planctomycetaceae bacterium]